MKKLKMIELTKSSDKDCWGRPFYTDQKGRSYVDVNMDDKSPAICIINKDGEPEYEISKYSYTIVNGGVK